MKKSEIILDIEISKSRYLFNKYEREPILAAQKETAIAFADFTKNTDGLRYVGKGAWHYKDKYYSTAEVYDEIWNNSKNK